MFHYLPQPKWESGRKRWVLRLQVKGQRKAFTSTIPRTAGKNEVREKAIKWLERFDSNDSVPFKTAFERYMEDYHERYGDSEQYDQIRKISRTHILPILGDIKCGDLRVEDYQKVISGAKPIARVYSSGKTVTQSKQLSKKYLKNIKGILTGFHKWAVARKYTDLIIDDALYIPASAPEGTREILQLEDITKIFSEPTGAFYERALMFEILTGVRPGELIGLKIEDYDAVTGIIHIRRAINNKNIITQGKNKNAKRDLALPDRVRQIVEEQIEVSKSCHSEWLFCQPSGQHGTQTQLELDWKRICKAHDISARTTPYSLRHTFYAHTEAFLPDRMSKMIFGHSDKTDSHALYGNHAIAGELEESRKKLEVTPIYKAVE